MSTSRPCKCKAAVTSSKKVGYALGGPQIAGNRNNGCARINLRTLSINEEIMAKLSQSFDNVVETTTTVEEQPSSVEVETVVSSQSPASTSAAVAAAS
jgi:hypothetical protein